MIVIYTEEGCDNCQSLKAWLDGRKTPYEERPASEIGSDIHANEIMAELAMNDMKLPVTWYKGEARSSESLKREVLLNG